MRMRGVSRARLHPSNYFAFHRVTLHVVVTTSAPDLVIITVTMGKRCRYLALAVVATAATLATVNATYRLPKHRCEDQLATYNAALFPAGPPEMEERTNLLIQQVNDQCWMFTAAIITSFQGPFL